MATSNLVSVFSGHQHGETVTGMLQVAIEAKGIPVVRHGGEYWPARLPGFSPIELLVPKDLAEGARQVIEEWFDSRGEDQSVDATWTCTSCGEENGAAFEVCWNCGGI